MSPGVLLFAVLGGGVPPGSPNAEPADQSKKCYFPHSFSDLASKTDGI